jgi:ABC-2 type transport system ATP-binding protein
MTEYIVETQGLYYQFNQQQQILKQISLQVPAGAIYGFLGPNGAGKTTTIRLLLGLLKKQKGEIFIFGKSFEQNRLAILQQVGALIETPSIYSHLTAKENLRLLQNVYRCPPSRIEEVLKLVGLDKTGSKTAGNFSLGMKQRLGIAQAILHQPQLLILDEPTNGLDPNGIIEIRQLLLQLNQTQGVSILISSHLLAEMEKMVTHIGVIHQGNILFQGSMQQLAALQAVSENFIIETGSPEKTFQVLSTLNISASFRDGKILIPNSNKNAIAQIVRQLVAHEIDIFQIATNKNDLENIFMNLINQ